MVARDGLLVCSLLALQVCGARHLAQDGPADPPAAAAPPSGDDLAAASPAPADVVPAAGDAAAGPAPAPPADAPTPEALPAEAVQVISMINKPVEEDLLVIIDLDVLAEAPSDAITSSGARRRLLQDAPANSKVCNNIADCSVTIAEKNDPRIFYKEYIGQGVDVTQTSALTVNLPDTPTGTPLTRDQLPNTVQLKISIGNTAAAQITPEVQNGTANNTLGPLPATTLRLYTYNLPKSYVVAPGITKVKVTASGGTTRVKAVWLDVNPGPPTYVTPQNIRRNATGSLTNVTFAAPTANFNGNTAAPTTCNKTATDQYPVGTTTIVCKATDLYSDATSFTITVVDVTAPRITVPADTVTKVATGPRTQVNYTQPTATDQETGTVNVVCDPASNSEFLLGNTTVTCNATDTAGNKATKSFTVTVGPPAKPVFANVPNLAPKEAEGPTTQVFWTGPNATDANGASIQSVPCSAQSGSFFPVGNNTVTCNATDFALQTSFVTFVVAIVDTPPNITTPGNIKAEATGPDGVTVQYIVSATDLVDGSVDVTCQPASNSGFALGPTTVTCSATDSSQKTATATFTVTVVDTTAPNITVPADATLPADGLGGEGSTGRKTIVNYAASATDLVDGVNIDFSCKPASGSGFELGETTVTCDAKDTRGNNATKSFKVTLEDKTPPAFVDATFPQDIIAEAKGAGQVTPVTYTPPTATDAVDADVDVVCVPVPSTNFTLGDTTVSCTATDDSRNSVNRTFTVSVRDRTPPAISVPANIRREADGSGLDAKTIVTYTASATDLVDGVDVQFFCDPPSGSDFGPVGETEVTCFAQDTRGNNATKSFTVFLEDTTAPNITGVVNLDVNATGINTTVTFTRPTAKDLGQDVPVECDRKVTSEYLEGKTTVTCTANDGRGNTGNVTFTVTVVDREAPTISANTSSASAASAATPLRCEATGQAAVMNPTSQIIDGCRFPNFDSLVTASDNVKVQSFACMHDGNVVNSDYKFPLGKDSNVVCTASDKEANTTRSFTVQARRCEWAGFSAKAPFFLDPIKTTSPKATMHSMSAERTLPVKFNLGGNYGMGFLQLYYGTTVCDTTQADLVTVSGNTTLSNESSVSGWKFDPVSMQYQYNLQVSSLGDLPDCYQVWLNMESMCPEDSKKYRVVLIKREARTKSKGRRLK